MSLDIARATRARPVRLDLGRGREVTIRPPSVDQAIACLSLDPAGPETPLDHLKRLRRQAQILLGEGHSCLTAELDQWQLAEVVSTLYVAACGLDAEAFARWQIAERKSHAARTSAQIQEELEALTATVAAELGKLPSEVGAQPLADIIALREQLAKLRERDLKIDAALHDKKLN